MKKFYCLLIIFLCFIVGPKSVMATNDVNIYIFRGSTCSHCEEALSYIKEHRDEIPENVNIITYEVWDNQNNQKLEQAVAKRLGIDTTNDKEFGVPFIVIGEEYLTGYEGLVTFNKIVSLAEKAKEDSEYKDIVEDEASKISVKLKSYTFEELYAGPNKTVTIIAYSILGAVIIGFLGMIIFSRK